MDLHKLKFTFLCICYLFFNHTNAYSKNDFITIQSTTSTVNSGLYDHILPIFINKHNINVKVVSVGTGQAIKNASRCDADILIVHSKKDEEEFVSNGYGEKRFDLMYNDFVIIGPSKNKVGISSSDDLKQVLKKIKDSKVKFVSRGDNSGTHKKEKELWQQISVEKSFFNEKNYIEVGQGMGSTLNIAIEVDGYVLSDRATWINFKNKKNHEIIFEDDKNLFNQYGIIKISKDNCPNTKNKLASIFLNWIVSKDGQDSITSFSIENKQLFFPNASIN